jgi:bacterioferritin (cytochrome b1)
VLVLILCWSQNWAHTRDAYNWGVDKIAQHEAQSIQDAVDHATLPAPSRPPQR